MAAALPLAAQQLSPEQLEAAVHKLEDWGLRVAHSAGLTHEENYLGWIPIVTFLGVALNSFNQWRTDFAARWNAAPVVNSLHLNGAKWFYGGFLVDTSAHPRGGMCVCLVPGPYKGLVLQVGQTTDTVYDVKGSIDQFWAAPDEDAGNFNDNPWNVTYRP